MNRLAMTMLAAGLTALAPSAGAQEDVQPQDRTYDVEVVSADAAARTLTIRSDSGTATLLVDAAALRGLQGLQPGSDITITVRNAATGQQEAITAIVNGTLRSRAPARARTTATTIRREVGTPVEVLGLDRGTRRITVRNGDKEQVFVIAGDTPVELENLAPGQRALLSWRFNREGKAEAVVRVTPGGLAAAGPLTTVRTEVARVPSPVEVVSADPELRTLTIRGERGESRTVLVDEGALAVLEELRPGDRVMLAWGEDRVLVITRQ